LRRYRLASRPAYIELHPQHLDIRLPGYFGGSVWRIPVADVCLVERGYERQVKQEVTTGKMLTRPVAVPFLRTTSPLRGVNLELLFRTKQRLPRIRLWGAVNATVPYLLAKSQMGAWVDGVALRVVDSDAARRALVQAGCQTTRAPGWWIADHRETTTDPADVAALTKGERSATRPRRAFFALGVLLLVVSRVAGKSAVGFLLLGLAMVAAVCAIWAGARGDQRRGLWDSPKAEHGG
jgi:hypothetical protein